MTYLLKNFHVLLNFVVSFRYHQCKYKGCDRAMLCCKQLIKYHSSKVHGTSLEHYSAMR